MLKGKTILQVLPWLDSGGVERGAVDIAAAILDERGNALVAAEPGRLSVQLKDMGGTILPFPGRSKNPYTILQSNAKLIEKMIREYHVDLVHARSRAPAWSALIAARRAGVPFVTTYHGAYSQKGRIKAFYNSVMAKGDVVIANSHYTARLVAKRNPDARDRIVTIQRGVDMDQFNPHSITEERILGLKKKWDLDARPIIILPSRLTRWKGQSFILPVFGAIRKAIGPSFQFLLIGDEQGRSAYASELDKLIAENDLSDCVKRVGHCADMPAAYMLADLVIVPSQDAETFGRSAAEGLSMGKPTLVGDLGAQPEVVAPPEGIPEGEWIAHVIQHADSEAWQVAITKALSLSLKQRAKIAPLARAHVAANFSLESMGSQTLDVYRKLLGL